MVRTKLHLILSVFYSPEDAKALAKQISKKLPTLPQEQEATYHVLLIRQIFLTLTKLPPTHGCTQKALQSLYIREWFIYLLKDLFKEPNTVLAGALSISTLHIEALYEKSRTICQTPAIQQDCVQPLKDVLSDQRHLNQDSPIHVATHTSKANPKSDSKTTLEAGRNKTIFGITSKNPLSILPKKTIALQIIASISLVFGLQTSIPYISHLGASLQSWKTSSFRQTPPRPPAPTRPLATAPSLPMKPQASTQGSTDETSVDHKHLSLRPSAGIETQEGDTAKPTPSKNFRILARCDRMDFRVQEFEKILNQHQALAGPSHTASEEVPGGILIDRYVPLHRWNGLIHELSQQCSLRVIVTPLKEGIKDQYTRVRLWVQQL